MADEFRQNVEAYIRLLRAEKTQSKALSEVRADKKRLKESLRSFMSTRNLEEATVPDTATLTIVPRKRVQALKRQAVETWARQVLGEDERTLQEVGRLYDSRAVKHDEDLVVHSV